MATETNKQKTNKNNNQTNNRSPTPKFCILKVSVKISCKTVMVCQNPIPTGTEITQPPGRGGPSRLAIRLRAAAACLEKTKNGFGRCFHPLKDGFTESYGVNLESYCHFSCDPILPHSILDSVLFQTLLLKSQSIWTPIELCKGLHVCPRSDWRKLLMVRLDGLTAVIPTRIEL